MDGDLNVGHEYTRAALLSRRTRPCDGRHRLHWVAFGPPLTNTGADVHAVSRRPESTAGGLTWHVAALTDANACDELASRLVSDVLFHLASAVTGARDVNLVRPLMMANQAAAVNLLTAVARSAPTARVVLAGSVEEPHLGHNLIPHSPYAAAKSATTAYARMFWALWNVRVSVLQIAMVYGPGQPDETKLVPYATRALLRGEAPRLTSGARLVDWVYVDDLVEALVRTAEADAAVGKVSISAVGSSYPPGTLWRS
jgi:UDP-glucose 4-epimerase